MYDFLDVGTCEIRREWHIEGQIDHGVNGREGRYRLAIHGAFNGLGDRHVYLVRPRHEAGRCHLLQAMTSLACDVAEPLHHEPLQLPYDAAAGVGE